MVEAGDSDGLVEWIGRWFQKSHPLALFSSGFHREEEFKLHLRPALKNGVTLDEHERSIIREALNRTAGNKSQAARLLGLTRNALRYRLSQMGIEDRGA